MNMVWICAVCKLVQNPGFNDMGVFDVVNELTPVKTCILCGNISIDVGEES